MLPTARLFRRPWLQRWGLATGHDIGDGPPVAHDVGDEPPCRLRRRRCALLLGSKPVRFDVAQTTVTGQSLLPLDHVGVTNVGISDSIDESNSQDKPMLVV